MVFGVVLRIIVLKIHYCLAPRTFFTPNCPNLCAISCEPYISIAKHLLLIAVNTQVFFAKNPTEIYLNRINGKTPESKIAKG